MSGTGSGGVWHDEGMLRRRAGGPLLIGGSVLVLVGLILLLGARLSLSRWVYVSEMGAPDMPTAGAVRIALLLVAAGGTADALGARHVRSRLLPSLAPSLVLLAAAACFALASQVTCTAGCPLPVGATFSWQDLIHTSAAVLGFASACVAMLQLAAARERPAVARLSLVAGVAVAVIAGAGAILSLLRVWMRLGGTLEFVATAVALLWLATVGLVLAREDLSAARASRARDSAAPRSAAPDRRPAPAPARAPRPEELSPTAPPRRPGGPGRARRR